MHRTWIVSEEGLQSHQTAQAARESDTNEYTTLAREMEQIGTTWLNILKVRCQAQLEAAPLFRSTSRALMPEVQVVWQPGGC